MFKMYVKNVRFYNLCNKDILLGYVVDGLDVFYCNDIVKKYGELDSNELGSYKVVGNKVVDNCRVYELKNDKSNKVISVVVD